MLKRFSLYWHTIRYLKVGQILWRLWYRFGLRIPPQCYPLTLTKTKDQWLAWQQNPNSYYEGGVYRVLNQDVQVNTAEDWNNPEIAKLALYNLHYFDDLNSVDANNKQQLHKLWVQQWIEQNPIGKGNGWEPYPLSLRMVNWIKWYLNQGLQPRESWIKSLSYQMSALESQLEYHILGNHLFANGKAMIFAGCYLEGMQASRCLRKGKTIVRQQLAEQILGDGAHFELSPMYQGIMLEDVLDLLNLARTYPDKMDNKLQLVLQKTAQKMLSWYAAMTHPNGEPAFFNDSANGIAKQYSVLKDYAKRLGLTETKRISSWLKDSGYVSFKHQDVHLLVDVAKVGPDYLPGHAHADTLSVELSVAGEKVLVNSGTSEYGIGEERQRQRSTAAHNTLSIPGVNSSEVWGGFRVARRARVKLDKFQETESELLLRAEHNGYQRLKGAPMHKRQIQYQSDRLIIVDELSSALHQAYTRFHIHPEIELQPSDKGFALFKQGKWLADIQVKQGKAGLVDSSYHPEFGVSIANTCIQIELEQGQSCVEWLFTQQSA